MALRAPRLASRPLAAPRRSRPSRPHRIAAAAAATPLPDPRAASLADYASLKARLASRARQTGAGLARYLFLTVSAPAAAATLVGTAAGSAYLALLFRDVDALDVDTPVPVMAAREVEGAPLRAAALAVAGLATGLKPRLLLYVALGAAYGAYNAANPGDPLPLTVAGGAALGFGSYKGPLLVELYDALRPRLDPDAGLTQQRPVLDLPDVETYRPGRGRGEEGGG